MIRYTKNSFCTIFYWWGGINRLVLPKACVYVVIASLIYFFQCRVDVEFYTNNQSFHDTTKGVLSFLVFLLVFRLNQCMSRHYAAYALMTDLFYGLERLMLDFCVHVHGDGGESYGNQAQQATNPKGSSAHHHYDPNSEEPPSPRAANHLSIASKINVIRLTIAYAISMVLHFQLLDAASDSGGEMDDLTIKLVLFLYCRLRGLLYDEEMELLDDTLAVMRDTVPGCDVVWRAEVSRYRVSSDPYSEKLLGNPDLDRSGEGVTIAPAPKIIMSMLVQALLRPSDQTWGYQSRLYNLFARITLKLVNDSMHLESIIMSPTPLPYLQHCRVLFLIFSLVFPMSMDTERGYFANVIMPAVIFWAIMGFEMLSGVLENPLGNDETDMNIYEKIHSLEVSAEQIFNTTECHKASLHHALLKTEQLVMNQQFNVPDVVRSHQLDPQKSFRTYFRWTPMPTSVLSDLMESHGEVENMHQLWLNFRTMCSDFSLRRMLRGTLHRQVGGRTYESVAVEEGGKAARSQMIVDFNKDPNYFCHFLEFVGAADTTAMMDERVGDGCSLPHHCGRNWRNRVLDLLANHPAQKLLKVNDAEDTERSLMMRTPRRSGLSSFFGGWESLS